LVTCFQHPLDSSAHYLMRPQISYWINRVKILDDNGENRFWKPWRACNSICLCNSIRVCKCVHESDLVTSSSNSIRHSDSSLVYKRLFLSGYATFPSHEQPPI
jgi:hypothetical protein